MDEIQRILQHTRDEAQKLMDHYTLYVPLRQALVDRIEAVGQASCVQEAAMRSRQVLQKVHDHILAQWSQGNAAGPQTPARLEKKADQLDKLAEWKDCQGKEDQAKRTHKRAEDLRKQAQKLIKLSEKEKRS